MLTRGAGHAGAALLVGKQHRELGAEADLVGRLLEDADRAAEVGERHRVFRLMIVGGVRERDDDRGPTDRRDLGDRHGAPARDDDVGGGHLVGDVGHEGDDDGVLDARLLVSLPDRGLAVGAGLMHDLDVADAARGRAMANGSRSLSATDPGFRRG